MIAKTISRIEELTVLIINIAFLISGIFNSAYCLAIFEKAFILI